MNCVVTDVQSGLDFFDFRVDVFCLEDVVVVRLSSTRSNKR